MKCPRCGRDTYSKKWDACTACKAEKRPVPKPAERIVSRETIPEREAVIAQAGIGRRYDWDKRERELGLRP